MDDAGKAESPERRVSMKKYKITALIAGTIVLLLAFFPYTTSQMISGDAEILTLENEKIGACTLSIEIQETRSLLFRYKKQFSFTLGGERNDSFLISSDSKISPSYAETDDGFCLISSFFYDGEKNTIRSCSLWYREDLSYADLRVDEERYVICSQ